MAQLSGKDLTGCPLSVVFELLLRQAGFLQTNGLANIFYVRDDQDMLCAVRVGLADDGWVLDAIPVDDPLAWNGEHLIFCSVPGF